MPVVALGVRMSVEVEVAVAPADEEPEGEEHDERRDRSLGALLDALGRYRSASRIGMPKTTSVMP